MAKKKSERVVGGAIGVMLMAVLAGFLPLSVVVCIVSNVFDLGYGGGWQLSAALNSPFTMLLLLIAFAPAVLISYCAFYGLFDDKRTIPIGVVGIVLVLICAVCWNGEGEVYEAIGNNIDSIWRGIVLPGVFILLGGGVAVCLIIWLVRLLLSSGKDD